MSRVDEDDEVEERVHPITLDKAISLAEEGEKRQLRYAQIYMKLAEYRGGDEEYANKAIDCGVAAANYRQMAIWFKELKEYKKTAETEDEDEGD